MRLSQGDAAPQEWTLTSLEKVCIRLTSGGTPSRRNAAFYNSGNIPWVKTSELQDRLIYDTEEHISELAIKNSSAKLLPVNTILLAMYGATVGQLGILGRPMACNQASAAICVNEEIADYRFVFYLLLLHRDQIRSSAVGAAQQNLSGSRIKEYEFRLPPLQEQYRIAGTLGILDDKIELNRRMAATLEEMARALYRSWFVDFDPVRAKAGGREPVDMEGGAAALFPGQLGEDGLPEGWRWEAFGGNYSVLETGKRPKGGVAYITDGIPSIGAESVDGLSIFDFSKTKYVPVKFFQSMKKGVIEDLDILVYKDGGKPGQLRPAVTLVSKDFPFRRACINEHVFRIRLHEEMGQHFGFLALSEKHCMSQMTELATGVAQPGLNQTAMKSLSFIRPSESGLLSVFNEKVRPFLDRCNDLARQSQTLAELRDMLLPKLMSGEIRVGELWELAEAAE